MSDSKSSRRRTDTGLPLGYVPPPPGASDPFDDPGQFTSANTEEPPTEDESPFEDELAEAAPVMANATPLPAPGTDPRELARRLAEEARARATASTAPKPAAEPPPKKKSLADRAPAPQAAPPQAAAPAPAPAAIPAPVPATRAPTPEPQAAQAPEPKKRSIADRARRPVISAAEAVRIAAEAEQVAAAANKKAKAEAATAAARPKPRKAPPAEPVAPAHTVADVLGRFVSGAVVKREVPITNSVVFRALWTAHRARAGASSDLGLLVTASVLLDAVERLPKGCLVAAHATLADRDVAVWIDVARGVVLGVAEPGEVYLAGL